MAQATEKAKVKDQEENTSDISIEEHHNRIKSVWMIYFMCLNASLGIFFLGFNQGVFNVVQLIILQIKDVTDDTEKSLYRALMTSLNPFGGLLGALVGTYVLKCCGGIKKSFFAVDICGIIGTVIILIKADVPNIVIGRFIQGLAQGVNTALVPIYIREFSPLEIAGRTASFVQLGQKGGLFMSYLFGLMLPTKHELKEDYEDKDKNYDNEIYWRIVLCIPILFCLIRSLVLLTCFRFETPTVLLQQHHQEELKVFLHMIYKDQDFQDAYNQALKKFHEFELHEMHDKKNRGLDDQGQHHNDNGTEFQHMKIALNDQENQTHEDLDDKKLKGKLALHGGSQEIKEKPVHAEYDPYELTESQIEREEEEFERIEKATKCRRNMLGWMISLTVSFSGIDAIFYYSNKIFEEGGMEEYAIYATIGIGFISILFSFVGMSMVDKTGRRPLLIGGSFIMCAGLVGILIGDLTNSIGLIIAAIAVFMFGYNATLGPIKWACYVELMDPFGVSVAASLIFVFAFLIALIFPFLVQALNLYGSFAIFLGLSILCLIYLYIEFKETKGKTHREIFPMYMKGYKAKVKKTPLHHNPAILQLQGISQIHLSRIGGNKKPINMASIHKSFHKSLAGNKSFLRSMASGNLKN